MGDSESFPEEEDEEDKDPKEAASRRVLPMSLPHTRPGDYGQSLYQDSGFQRVLLQQNLNFKGWISHVLREFPGKLASRNLSRDTLSREIGHAQQVAISAILSYSPSCPHRQARYSRVVKVSRP